MFSLTLGNDGNSNGLVSNFAINSTKFYECHGVIP